MIIQIIQLICETEELIVVLAGPLTQKYHDMEVDDKKEISDGEVYANGKIFYKNRTEIGSLSRDKLFNILSYIPDQHICVTNFYIY